MDGGAYVYVEVRSGGYSQRFFSHKALSLNNFLADFYGENAKGKGFFVYCSYPSVFGFFNTAMYLLKKCRVSCRSSINACAATRYIG